MVDLLVRGGTLLTMNADREVIEDGAVAVDDGRIRDVGPTERIDADYDGDRTLDAGGHVVLPGLIDVHVHVADVLARGIGHNRSLHDWLFNVKRPVVGAMDADDHAIAAALYVREALQSGITTLVENAGGTGVGYPDDVIEAKLDVYADAGVRNVYAHGFLDQTADEAMERFVGIQTAKAPDVVHPDPDLPDTDDALDRTESLIETHHGSANGRQSVWPAPYLAGAVSDDALEGAYALAEEYDVLTTTHTAEARVQERHLASSVERLHGAGYLGERTLLGHCVHVDERDRRLLATTGTKVAHNVVANLSLGSGVSPVPAMLDKGITVGLGTDNPCQNDRVDLLADARVAALTHKGHHEDPGVLTAERVLELATVDAAHAIGRGSDLGSVEPGTAADLISIDLDRPHLTPHPNVAAALVYGATGRDVDAVVCDGEVVCEGESVRGVDGQFPDLHADARAAADGVVARAGLQSLCDEGWTTVSPN